MFNLDVQYARVVPAAPSQHLGRLNIQSLMGMDRNRALSGLYPRHPKMYSNPIEKYCTLLSNIVCSAGLTPSQNHSWLEIRFPSCEVVP